MPIFLKKTEAGPLSEIRQKVLCLQRLQKQTWIIRELRQAADIVRVFPFSSQNKDMSTIVRENGKEILYVKGNPEKIISLCTGISEEEKKRIST